VSGGPLQRIGFVCVRRKPIEEVARFLVGTHSVDEAGNPDCESSISVIAANWIWRFELPKSPLEAVDVE